MRFVTNLLPSVNPLSGNEEVQGLFRAPVIESRYPPQTNTTTIKSLAQYQSQTSELTSNDANENRRVFTEDRRKMNQRIRKDPVLVELRSGRDRRRRHLRATDIVERIDIKA